MPIGSQNSNFTNEYKLASALKVAASELPVALTLLMISCPSLLLVVLPFPLTCTQTYPKL